MSSIAIIGAGMSGLAAAKRLSEVGHAVQLFERGAAVGGRCAAERHGPLRFDKGPPFFEARDPKFLETVEQLKRAGVIRAWTGRVVQITPRGQFPCPSGLRLVGTPDMRAIPESLAEGQAIALKTNIAEIKFRRRHWILRTESNDDIGKFDALILAMPPEQALRLLYWEPTAADWLSRAHSIPRWVAMLHFEYPLKLDFDAAHVSHEQVQWIARESSKPERSAHESWTVHSTSTWSQRRVSHDPVKVAGDLADAFRSIVNHSGGEPAFSRAHRWKLAEARSVRPLGPLVDSRTRLAVCGDWATDSSVEGAYLSGWDAAEQLAKSLETTNRLTA